MIFWKFFFSAVLAFGLNIQAKAQNESLFTKRMAEAYDMNDSLLRIWRSDKYGCRKRRVAFIDSLFKPEKLANIPKKVFLILYGKPDKFHVDGTLIYRNVMHCTANNTAQKETNSLDVAVFFKDGHLIYFEKIFVE